jgi:hypothetical protein
LSVVEYLAKMQSLGNNMAMAGKPLDDKDLVQYILAGLDEDYVSVVNSILAHPPAITVRELVAQMLAFESHVDLRGGGSGSSSNLARRGQGGFNRGTGNGRTCHGGHPIDLNAMFASCTIKLPANVGIGMMKTTCLSQGTLLLL